MPAKSRPSAPKRAPSALREFMTGVREETPLMLGVVPFGLIFGVLGTGAGLDPVVVFFMSSIVFGGASQVVFAQLAAAGAGGAVIAATVGVVNLRHMLYSAAMVKHLSGLGRGWKVLLSYLLTDEAFFVSFNRMETRPPGPKMHYHLLGSGLMLWVCWQAATLAGIMLGATLPGEWNLDFALPLTFLALLVPLIRSVPAAVAMAVAGACALLFRGLPLNLWIIAAAAVGMAAGYAAESLLRWRRA